MVYTYLGRPAKARKLMGSPTDGTNGTPVELSPTDMEDALQYGHGQLILWSSLTPAQAVPTHPFIDQLMEIEEHFASSYYWSTKRDPEGKSTSQYSRAKSMIEAMLQNQPTSQTNSASYTSQAYTYRTTALNASRPKYVSPRVDT
jgi:hypothetical protein